MKYIYKFIIALSLLSSSTSCSLDIPFEDKVADPDAVTDLISAQRVLAAAYGNYTDWKSMLSFTAMSDDVMPTPLLPKNIMYFQNYHWREEQLIDEAKNAWNNGYETIMYINAVLERLPNVQVSTKPEQQQLLAIEYQAKALKAMCYFNLMRVFSPRYVSSEAANQLGIVKKDHVVSEQPSRMTLLETADAIRNLILPYIHATELPKMSNRYITPLGARCLAAELELWCENYETVITLCEPIVASIGNQSISENAYNELWAQKDIDDKTCIFNIDFAPFTGSLFFDDWGFSDGDYFVINETVQYEANDIRKTASVTPYDFPLNFGASYRSVNLLGKYNGIRQNKQYIRFISGYRMADFIFLCAEAYARTGKKEQAVALMNHYLSQRHVSEIPKSIDVKGLINRILDEKQKEFLGEGRRFFDLKRLGNKPLTRNIVFDRKGISIAPDDFRWTLPIPTSEYLYNPNIKQNEGWQERMPKPQL